MLAAPLVLAVLAALAPAPPARFAVDVQRDVVYGTAAVRRPQTARKPLLLDLYEPRGDSGKTQRPGVVLAHGGGWTSGDKSRPPYVPDLCRDLASRGYVCASIDYRLTGDDPPGSEAAPLGRAREASIEDIGMAVRWLVSNAGGHRIDPKRIAVGGTSAGAGTALFLAYGEAGRSLPIRAALDLWGGLLSKTAWIEKGEPALLIVHGTADEVTPFSVAQELAARAKEVGVAHELIPVEGGRHNPPLAPLYDRIAEFLERHL